MRFKLSVYMSVALFAAANGATAQDVKSEVIARGLEHPWAVAFLPEGQFLVTERPGRLRVIDSSGQIQRPVEGVPEVAARGQGGLLDVITDSSFADNRVIYLCYSEPGPGNTNSTALARARLSEDQKRLSEVKVIFRQKPKVSSNLHFGCRIVERRVNNKPDGTLFLTLGDRFSQKEEAQKLDNHLGKVVRVGKNGSVPQDNPFIGRHGAQPEIWSYGHRNGQGATLTPSGEYWMTEHGPQGGDEINAPQAGKNYGWPVITYGENYGGGKIGEGMTEKSGMEQPLHYWTPSIAPSGMAFLTSDRYGSAWKGNLFVGSLKFQYLNRIEVKGTKVVAEHALLKERGDRIRDVRQGPDGLIYLLTDSSRGQLLRLTPP